MPSILSDNDKEIVKRVVPKGSNKIFAVAVAKLYVAYPNKQRWVYTGLQGAAVLCNDLVGNTLWIKVVDISVCSDHWRRSPTALIIARGLIVECSGIRKYMICFITIKIGHSSTLSNSKIVWLVFRS